MIWGYHHFRKHPYIVVDSQVKDDSKQFFSCGVVLGISVVNSRPECFRPKSYKTEIKHGWLVGGWTTHLENMLVKLDHVPKFRMDFC